MTTTDRRLPQTDDSGRRTPAELLPRTPLIYRPLDPSWGSAADVAALRALRAVRASVQEREIALVVAADARERARRRVPTAPRHRGPHRGWHLLPV